MSIGNTYLKIANLNNLEGRLEYYPNAGEVISIGGFCKQIKNQIEYSLEFIFYYYY